MGGGGGRREWLKECGTHNCSNLSEFICLVFMEHGCLDKGFILFLLSLCVCDCVCALHGLCGCASHLQQTPNETNNLTTNSSILRAKHNRFDWSEKDTLNRSKCGEKPITMNGTAATAEIPAPRNGRKAEKRNKQSLKYRSENGVVYVNLHYSYQFSSCAGIVYAFCCCR